MFATIEGNNEWLVGLEQDIEIRIRESPADRDDPLMAGVLGHTIQDESFFPSNRHTSLAREVQNFLQLAGVHFTSDVDALDRHTLRNQSFVNRMDAAYAIIHI